MPRKKSESRSVATSVRLSETAARALDALVERLGGSRAQHIEAAIRYYHDRLFADTPTARPRTTRRRSEKPADPA